MARKFRIVDSRIARSHLFINVVHFLDTGDIWFLDDVHIPGAAGVDNPIQLDGSNRVLLSTGAVATERTDWNSLTELQQFQLEENPNIRVIPVPQTGKVFIIRESSGEAVKRDTTRPRTPREAVLRACVDQHLGAIASNLPVGINRRARRVLRYREKQEDRDGVGRLTAFYAPLFNKNYDIVRGKAVVI